MSSLGVYLIEASVCLAVFYFLFIVLCRRTTFFNLNRLYLVLGLVLTFMLPLIKLPANFGELDFTLANSIENTFSEFETGLLDTSGIQPEAGVRNYILYLYGIYWAGVAFMFFQFLLSVFRIVLLISNSKTERLGSLRIVRTNLLQPFTCFNLVFLPQGENSPIVIEHERVHVRQHHWADLILAEAGSIFLWFNPLIYFYKGAIKLQHEYLADSTVATETRVEPYLNYLLRQVQVQSSITPISQFYSSTIKKRISMIAQSKSPKHLSIRYLLLLPVVCLLLFAFSGKQGRTRLPASLAANPEENIPSIFPVEPENSAISSGYGMRKHPVLGKEVFHRGVDFRMPQGNVILSTADGVVGESRYDSLYGNFIVIRHSATYATKYAHLKNAIVRQGDVVKQGQTIGYSGATGFSSTPHLHYEVFKNGNWVNPADYLPAKK